MWTTTSTPEAEGWLGEASGSGSTAAAVNGGKAGASSFERRQGKWTRAECEYAMLLIEHFTSGRLPGCSGGESLRTTLSECLMCTPMRITKKLSATHAIGKCCFKKKGELKAKERVDLEAARHAFLASVEKRGGSGSVAEAPGRKRTRLAADDSWDLGEASSWPSDLGEGGGAVKGADDAAMKDEWLTSPHAVSGSAEPLAPSVSARLTADGKTKVRVVAGDRTGLIGEISIAFQRRGLSITSCVAETLPGDVAHDEFDVVIADTKQPLAAEPELRSLEKYLERVLSVDPAKAANDEANDDANSETSSVKTRNGPEQSSHPGMNDNNKKKISATTLQVTVPDRPGLLKQITTSLASLKLSIVGAKIETVEADELSESTQRTALDTFDVVDAESGGPVLDPLRLRAIEERLARDLEASPTSTAEAAAPVAAAPFPAASSRPLPVVGAPPEDDVVYGQHRYFEAAPSPSRPHEEDSWTAFSRTYFS